MAGGSYPNKVVVQGESFYSKFRYLAIIIIKSVFAAFLIFSISSCDLRTEPNSENIRSKFSKNIEKLEVRSIDYLKYVEVKGGTNYDNSKYLTSFFNNQEYIPNDSWVFLIPRAELKSIDDAELEEGARARLSAAGEVYFDAGARVLFLEGRALDVEYIHWVGADFRTAQDEVIFGRRMPARLVGVGFSDRSTTLVVCVVEVPQDEIDLEAFDQCIEVASQN